MKALLCLLSGQHVPNLLSAHHFLPNRLILIESDEMKRSNAADRFLSALALGGVNYKRCCAETEPELVTQDSAERVACVVPLDSVDNLASVQAGLSRAFALADNAEWIVNLTGGNKLMALAAYEYFKSRKGRFFYIEHNAPRELIPLDDQTHAETCSHTVSIAEFLAGYGFELRRSSDKLKEVEQEVHRLWETSRILTEYSTGDDLFPFDRDQTKHIREKKPFELDNHWLNPLAEPVREALSTTLEMTPQGTIRLDKLNRGGDFVTGGWLEVFVCGLLQRHASELQVNDVQRSVLPYACENQSANDLDVAFIDHKLALVMIECKSGRQDHEGAKDILYKVDSVIGQSKALKARAILATTSDFLIDQRRGDFENRVKELRNLLGLTLVTREQLQTLARDPDNVELIRSIFLK